MASNAARRKSQDANVGVTPSGSIDDSSNRLSLRTSLFLIAGGSAALWAVFYVAVRILSLWVGR